jgi:2'-5' RNA ligase
MDSIDDKVMVALLPIFSDGMNVEFPHLTLVYAGRLEDLSPSDLDGMSKAAASIAMLSRPVTLRTLTKDIFGEGTDDSPKVDVLRFHPNLDLLKMRATLQDWDVSQFQFSPHMTIGPEGSWNGEIPRIVAFDKVCFAKGTERQEFHLSRTMGEGGPGEW